MISSDDYSIAVTWQHIYMEEVKGTSCCNSVVQLDNVDTVMLERRQGLLWQHNSSMVSQTNLR